VIVRPRPPSHLHGLEAVFSGPKFEPAPELLEWLTSTILVEGAPLENPDHLHLTAASIGVLWTNVANSRHGRRIVGQAEFKPPAGGVGKWARARAESQILGWFGQKPDFMLTFDAEYATACSDIEFCALVEHELYHCGQERDEFGAPKFHKSGLPAFCLRGHDVEEFTGIVRRYGVAAAHVEAFVQAAQLGPDVEGPKIAVACGSCAGKG